jgi:hypothetical protein
LEAVLARLAGGLVGTTFGRFVFLDSHIDIIARPFV